MDDYSNAHWGHFGRRLVASRGRRSVAAVAAASGISAKSIGNFENAREQPKKPTGTMYALAEFYGWTPDSLDRVLLERGYETTADPIDQMVAEVDADEVKVLGEVIDDDTSTTPSARRRARKAAGGLGL